MDDFLDEPETENSEADAALEEAPPPRPVRGLLWILAPVPIGAAAGTAWSAVYAAGRGLDFSTPVLIGGAIGLAVGAFLWAFFPYKAGPRKRPDLPKRGPS